MTKSLEELLEKKQAAPASKRLYFQKNKALIFQLIESGATHAEILEAIEKDGVKMSLRYFSRLLNESENESKQPKSNDFKDAAKIDKKPDLKNKDKKEITPEKALYIAEVEAIQNDSTLTLKQKRDQMMDAELRFSKSLRLR